MPATDFSLPAAPSLRAGPFGVIEGGEYAARSEHATFPRVRVLGFTLGTHPLVEFVVTSGPFKGEQSKFGAAAWSESFILTDPLPAAAIDGDVDAIHQQLSTAPSKFGDLTNRECLQRLEANRRGLRVVHAEADPVATS